jgi:hypothetical protein
MTRSPLVPGKDLDFSAATATTATSDRDDEETKKLAQDPAGTGPIGSRRMKGFPGNQPPRWSLRWTVNQLVALQPQLPCAVLPEQIPVPDVTPNYLNRAMPSLVHDRSL